MMFTSNGQVTIVRFQSAIEIVGSSESSQTSEPGEYLLDISHPFTRDSYDSNIGFQSEESIQVIGEWW
jgi:hypothetical protein